MTALSLRPRFRLGISPKGGRPGAQDPNQLSGLAFWYDAAQSPVVETAGAVERLDDISGNANHAEQASASARPLKVVDASGRSVIRFDGSDDSLGVTTPPSFAAGVTVFIAFRVRQRGDFEGIFSASAAAGTDHVDFFTFQNASAASNLFQLFGRSTESDTLLWQPGDDGGLSYAIFALGGGSGRFRALDGGASDTYDGGFGTPDEIVLGARFNSGLFGHAAVDLYEVGLYPRKISTSQQASLEAYLSGKYQTGDGLMAQGQLDTGEPLGPDWSFSRPSTGTVRDHDDIRRTVKTGELRRDGLRRVSNLYPSSASPATQVLTVVAGAKYAFHFRDGGGSGSFALSGATTATVNEGEGYTFTAGGTSLTCTLSGTPGAAATVQLEDISGASVEAPGDYVDSDVEHDAKVVGVRYFSTTNGNGFTAPGPGAVTEAEGSEIAAATRKGALLEPQRTNLARRSWNLTASPWSAIGTSVAALNQVGIDGIANHATTLTDDNGSGYEGVQHSNVSVTNGVQYTATWVVKKDSDTSRFPCLRVRHGASGDNNLVLNTSTGATHVQLGSYDTISVELIDDWWWVRATFTTTSTTVNNYQIFPAFATTLTGTPTSAATGSIIIGHVQLEQGAFATSPIPTTGSAVTRVADLLTLPAPGVAPGAIGVELGFELVHDPAAVGSANLRLFGSDDAAGTTEEIRTEGAGAWAWTPETGDKGGALEIDTADLAAETPHTLGFSLTNGEQVAVLDAATELDDSQSLALDHSDTELQLGFWDGAGSLQMPVMWLRSFSYWTRNVVRSRIGA